ncbi:hypothetical protein XM38_028710 [Halomicronema hongdechloris C2206]|uniref:Uncharacterized protein n=1 Tax=Halomicronema hongdechloris C2206 TaxID=1641165 RepID=A0A1Z3HP33_9CYAN|nr:hypothetical protein XM38_028710 [Halomicronema hongdechloris C2206]
MYRLRFVAKPDTQDFSYCPSLGKSPAWSVGRIPIKDFAEGANTAPPGDGQSTASENGALQQDPNTPACVPAQKAP